MTLKVEGLDELARELRRIDPRLNKELTKAHKEIATKVASKAAGKVSRLGVPRAGAAAAGIRPRAGQQKATVALLGSNPWVRAVVMGAEQHWVFGRPVLAEGMSRRVFRPWIGADWTPESGLYGVSPAIASSMPNIIDTYADHIMKALSKAFPD